MGDIYYDICIVGLLLKNSPRSRKIKMQHRGKDVGKKAYPK
jgi:hypothetical protein